LIDLISVKISLSFVQEKLGALKYSLVEKRREHMYEAYLWKSRFDLDPTATEQLAELSTHSVEDRLFEDPLYLMQYNILWQGPPDRKAENVENSAFIMAENEIYLRKVRCIGGFFCLTSSAFSVKVLDQELMSYCYSARCCWRPLQKKKKKNV